MDITEPEIAIFCGEEMVHFKDFGYSNVKRIEFPEPETLHEILRIVGGSCYICGNYLEEIEQYDIIFGVKQIAHDICLIMKKDHKEFIADDPEIIAMKKASRWQPFLYYDELVKRIEENKDIKISTPEIIKLIEDNKENEDIKISLNELKKISEETKKNEGVTIRGIKISVTGPKKGKENEGIKISVVEPQKDKKNEALETRFNELRELLYDVAEQNFDWPE